MRGNSLICVTYLINYCPDIVFILDNNYKIAQDIALIHKYKNIHDLLEETYNKFLRDKDFDLKKVFKNTLKDVKIRREKFQKIVKKSFEKVINEYDYSTIKKSEDASLINNDEAALQAKLNQAYNGRLMVVPK